MSEEVCEHLKVEEEGTGVKAFPYSMAVSHLADLSSDTQDKIWVRIIVQKWTQNLLGNIKELHMCSRVLLFPDAQQHHGCWGGLVKCCLRYWYLEAPLLLKVTLSNHHC